MSPLPLYATPGKPETALVHLQHRLGLSPQVVLLPNLRLSGLLHVLTPELLQLFVVLLTFQDTLGEIRATPPQLAAALKLHPEQAEARIRELAAYTFDSAPLVFESPEGIWCLSKRVGVPIEQEPQRQVPQESYQLASKEELLRLSRERYATPRAEAEATVADQLGLQEPEPIPEGREGEAYQALLSLGVPELEVRRLLAEFPIEEIEQQLAWLQERGARNSARFIVAAIKGNYASPERSAHASPEERFGGGV